MKAPAIQDRSDHRGTLEGLRAELPVTRQALGDGRFELFALDRESKPWPEFVIDLTRFERAFNEVSFSPGSRAATRLGSATLGELTRVELAKSRLETVDSSRLLALRYPVAAYFEAVRAGLAPLAPAPCESFALLFRPGRTVKTHRISRPEFVVLGLLKRGETVGDALEAIDAGDGREALGMTARSWLEGWSDRGLFTSISR